MKLLALPILLFVASAFAADETHPPSKSDHFMESAPPNSTEPGAAASQSHSPEGQGHGQAEGHLPNMTSYKLKPATRYSGRTPIDLDHGLLFNNGTFGLPNAEYETWAQGPYLAPSLAEKPYPYNRKDDFVGGVRESLQFIETASSNWSRVSPDTKPEVVAYAKASLETMKPLIEKLENAVSAADSAGKKDWDKAQEDARLALIDARSTYAQLHKNVRR